MGCQVVGFDNNPAMLSRAFERRETSSFSDWQIFEASLEQTPALSIGFDGILLNNVLFYVKNIDTVLEWLAKLLLPGGRMVITGPWQRPDLGVVMSQSIRQWQDCGEWDEELQQSFDRFVRVSQKLVSDSSEMQTFFRAEELIGRLRDHFELKVLSSSETDYFGQNFFVAVERI
jgi:ubiquinone/menaquinone biosynthesis C-methylase UbiE